MVIIFVPMGVAFTVIALLWTIYHDCRNRVCVQNRRKKRDLEENVAGAGPVQQGKRIRGGSSGMPHVVEEIPRLPMFKWTMEDLPRIPGVERLFGRRSLILAMADTNCRIDYGKGLTIDTLNVYNVYQ
jgi:hypothetical protein